MLHLVNVLFVLLMWSSFFKQRPLNVLLGKLFDARRVQTLSLIGKWDPQIFMMESLIFVLVREQCIFTFQQVLQ